MKTYSSLINVLSAVFMLLLPFKPYFFMKAELLMAVTIFSRAMARNKDD